MPDQLRRTRDYSRDGVLRSIDATGPVPAWTGLTWCMCMTRTTTGIRQTEEAIPTLADLRSQGVLRAIGVGMNQSAMLARFLRETPVDLVMLAGLYTLLEQNALGDVLATAAAVHKRVVPAVGVFNSGILARPRPRPGAKFNYEAAAPEVIARAKRDCRRL